MKTYIDAEQLSEKIESIGLYVQKSADYNDGRNDMKMMVLDIIDSLQHERPEADIKKELYSYICSDAYMNTREDGSLLIARHFYELGLNARSNE